MSLNTYIEVIEAATQGAIKGSVTQTGREGWQQIIAANHEIVSPRDAASGLPTGKRQHKPFTFTMEYDKSLPLFYSALVNNETIKNVTFSFWSPNKIGHRGSGTGLEVKTLTIKLTNAHFSNIELRMANNKHPELSKFETYCTLAMTYQAIEWTWVDGGITAGDDWEAPAA